MSFPRYLLLALLATNRALGEPVPGGQVRVERTERALACPTEQALVQQTLALGSAPTSTSSAPIEVLVQLDGDSRSLSASIRASGAKTGERTLRTDGSDCRKLAESVAVVIAVLLDLVPPDATASFDTPVAEPAPPARPEPAALPPVLPASPTVKPAPPPPVVARADPLSALVRGEVALAVGFLGGVLAPAAELGASLGRSRWEVGLGGMWLRSRDVPFAAIAGTHVNLDLALGVAEGCLALARSPRGHWDSWLCGRAVAGRLTGAGQGFDHPRVSHSLWAGTGPGLAFRVRLTRGLSFRASLNGLVTLASHSFVVDGYGPAFDTPRFSAALAAGPELSIL